MTNWRTTISGIGAALFTLLAVLATAADQLGELNQLLPPDVRHEVILVSALSAFVLRIWNSVAQADAKHVPAATNDNGTH